MDLDKALEADNGFLVSNGGPFYTGGSASPVGLDLPTGTFYLQTTASGVLIWRKYGANTSDWRQLSAQDILFDKTGLKFNATNVKDAIVEVQDRSVNSLQILTSSLNVNYNIGATDSYIHDVKGTATGYSLTLPNATQAFLGRRYEVSNSSSQSITVKDNAGTILITLVPGDLATFTLEVNATAAGVWIIGVSTSSATGITSYVVTSDTGFSTTSVSDTLITGFTVTPNSGRYSVFFSANITIGANNALAQFVAYRGGAAVGNTRRSVQGVSSNFVSQTFFIGEVTVNGSQAVDVRVNISTGNLAVNQRSLILVRLGAQ